MALREHYATTRERIARLEEVMRQAPQADFPLKHTFVPGVYAREIFIPKGSCIVGKIHRHEHLNFISSGEVSMLTPEGIQHIKGPCTMVSKAGTKRALYAHEDTVWTTIHANPDDERDLEKIESYVIAESYELLEQEWRARIVQGGAS